MSSTLPDSVKKLTGAVPETSSFRGTRLNVIQEPDANQPIWIGIIKEISQPEPEPVRAYPLHTLLYPPGMKGVYADKKNISTEHVKDTQS